MIRDNTLSIYTDGSSLSHPRRGGIGVRIIAVNEEGNEVIEEHELQGYQQATNNEMEIMACIEGLRLAAKHAHIGSVDRICIYTDSMYVVDNVVKALVQWPKQKWLDRSGRPFENVPLWKELTAAIRKAGLRVDFNWVKGHAKNVHNKAADKLAKSSAKGPNLQRPLKGVAVRRKITSGTVELGSVLMRGQEMDVRIITDTLLKPQRVYKYKYEVLPSTPDFAGKVDQIYSDHFLRAGHHYRVRVNSDMHNPRIEEVISELDRQINLPLPLTDDSVPKL